MSFMHPIRPPEGCNHDCVNLPRPCRDHVHVFFIHGMDPLNFANLTGVRDYVQELGFNKIYYGQMYHAGRFAREVKRVSQQDPQARFVLVGFSFGANFARDVANDVGKENIPIDLLVYFGGNTLKNVPEDQPENAGTIINILASGFIWNGDHLDRAENLQIPEVWHFGSPSHAKSLEILSRELAAVASRVPVIESAPLAPRDEPEPTPRPVPPTMPRAKDDADFLKPVSRMDFHPSVELKAKAPGGT
jgi:pimeloyl-ACP methyl ester carboxylesterase